MPFFILCRDMLYREHLAVTILIQPTSSLAALTKETNPMSNKSYSYDEHSNTVQAYDSSYDNEPESDYRTGNFMREVGSVRVTPDGIQRLGTVQHQSYDPNPQTIQFYNHNGSMHIDPADATDDSIVHIPGYGQTTFGVAKRSGLIVQAGSPEESMPKKNSEVTPTESPFQGFETPNVSKALSGLQQMTGSREAVHGIANTAMARISEGNVEGAAEALAHQTGLELSTATEAVEDIYGDYSVKAGEYVKTLGVDPDAVGDFFDSQDSAFKNRVMVSVFNGMGKEALNELVNRFKKSQRR
jgi:hypothetical protein